MAGGSCWVFYASCAKTQRKEKKVYMEPHMYQDEAKDPKKGTGKKPKDLVADYTQMKTHPILYLLSSAPLQILEILFKVKLKSKSHKRQSQIINLIHQRVRAAYNNAKDPKVKSRLKKAYDYAKTRKEASKRKTQRMNKSK